MQRSVTRYEDEQREAKQSWSIQLERISAENSANQARAARLEAEAAENQDRCARLEQVGDLVSPGLGREGGSFACLCSECGSC